MTGTRSTTMKQLGLGLTLSTKKTRKGKFLDGMERVVAWATSLRALHYSSHMEIMSGGPRSPSRLGPYCRHAGTRGHRLAESHSLQALSTLYNQKLPLYAADVTP